MAKLLAVKPLSLLKQESSEEGEHTLKRSLGPVNLITLGIGAIIGAGIFVLTGQAAALHAGPAIALSFVVAGITCAFAGLCYAEFASIIPIAGSAYTYGYATLGELVAWIIGWDLVLEYAFGAATVASGWSGYLLSLLEQLRLDTVALAGALYDDVRKRPVSLSRQVGAAGFAADGRVDGGTDSRRGDLQRHRLPGDSGRDYGPGDRDQGIGQSQLGNCHGEIGCRWHLPGAGHQPS